MNQGERKSILRNLSGGISARQIIFRFILSLAVALAARAIYGIAADDGAADTKAVVAQSTAVPSTRSVTPTTTGTATTTVAPTSTIFETDPERALANLAQSLTAKDYSKIAEGADGDCAKAAVIVLVDEVRFYKWTDQGWTEYSDLISIGNVGAPLAVTSADYTADGMIDFLVTYDAPNSSDPFVGGIFAANRCAWNWLDFESQVGRSNLASLLSFDPSRKKLTASVSATSDEEVNVRFNVDRLTFELESSPETSAPPEIDSGATDVYEDSLASFFESLSRWTLDGFQEMEQWTAPFSPAQDYARHLAAGREAEIAGGFIEGTPLEYRREGGTYRVCFTDACEYFFTDFTVNSSGISDFKVNGLSLSEIVRFNQSPEAGAVCSDAGTCLNWRSLYSGIETTYLVLRISGFDAEKKFEFAGATLTTDFGKRRQDKFVAAVIEPGSSGSWLLRFPTAEPPIGGSVVVRVRQGGKVFSHEIALPRY